jgi:general transcription factor 3C polypeptide 3 (transcription factor C subunit 4)
MTFAHRALHLTPQAFQAGPEQKFVLRQVKQMDYNLATKDDKGHKLNLFPIEQTSNVPYDGDTHDPALLHHYAHIMLAGSAPQPALNYYLRAYTMRPNDPQLLLSIGMAYISNSIRRVSSNRHYQIQQGLSFIKRYYNLRQESDKAILRQEAEFNSAMAYHILNLSHLAIPGFQKVIEMSEQVQKEGASDEVEDFAREAAMAIQSIMVLNGDQAAAERIVKEHLVL